MNVIPLESDDLGFKKKALALEQSLNHVVGSINVLIREGYEPLGAISSAERNGLRFNTIRYSGVNLQRSMSAIAKEATPIFSLTRPVAGQLRVDHDGQTRLLQPGFIYLFNHSVPYETAPEWEYATESVIIPATALHERTRTLLPFYALPLPCSDSPKGSMLAEFASRLQQGFQAWSDREFDLLSHQFLDLIGLFFLHHHDADQPSDSSTRVAYRTRAQVFVRDNFTDSMLTPRAVAQACGISVSYLHQLFKDEALSVEAFIIEQRLLRCRNMLINPAHDAQSISAILYDAGFNDPAHFSRCFKLRFGKTPTEMRRNSVKVTGVSLLNASEA